MKKLVHIYDEFEGHVLAISLAFTTLLIFVQVIMRYVFNNSLSWSEELARYIFIWQIWWGTSISMKHKEHISMDMLRNALHGKAKVCLQIFANLILLAFCVWLVINGWALVSSMMSRNTRSVALRIPMWIIYSSLPFSQLMVALRLIGHLAENFKDLMKSSDELEGGNA